MYLFFLQVYRQRIRSIQGRNGISAAGSIYDDLAAIQFHFSGRRRSEVILLVTAGIGISVILRYRTTILQGLGQPVGLRPFLSSDLGIIRRPASENGPSRIIDGYCHRCPAGDILDLLAGSSRIVGEAVFLVPDGIANDCIRCYRGLRIFRIIKGQRYIVTLLLRPSKYGGILVQGQGIGTIVVGQTLGPLGDILAAFVQLIARSRRNRDFRTAFDGAAGLGRNGLAFLIFIGGCQSLGIVAVNVIEDVTVPLEDRVEGAADIRHHEVEGAFHFTAVFIIVGGSQALLGVAPLLEVVAFIGFRREGQGCIPTEHAAASQGFLAAGQGTAVFVPGSTKGQSILFDGELHFNGGGFFRHHGVSQGAVFGPLSITVNVPILNLIAFVRLGAEDHPDTGLDLFGQLLGSAQFTGCNPDLRCHHVDLAHIESIERPCTDIDFISCT